MKRKFYLNAGNYVGEVEKFILDYYGEHKIMLSVLNTKQYEHYIEVEFGFCPKISLGQWLSEREENR